MKDLKEDVKKLGFDMGLDLIGVASLDRLVDAPLYADPKYILPEAQSVITFAIKMDREAIRAHFGKKDRLAHTRDQKRGAELSIKIGKEIQKLLESSGHKARSVEPNLVYREEYDLLKKMVPDLSHRYMGVAAGLGRIGWSSHLVTPEFGAAVYLSSVVTSAKLEPDPLCEKDTCIKCKLCAMSCPTGAIDIKKEVKVNFGGMELTHGLTSHLRCLIPCAGFTGLSRDRTWSTWSPGRLNLPKDDSALPEFILGDPTIAPFLQILKDLTMLELFDVADFSFTCSNCALVCWENLEDKKANYKLLTSSGCVVEGTDGIEVVKEPAQS